MKKLNLSKTSKIIIFLMLFLLIIVFAKKVIFTDAIFIPIIESLIFVFILLSIFMVLSLIIYKISIFRTKTNISLFVKILMVIIMIILSFFIISYVLLYGLFGMHGGNKFIYNEEVYYFANTGFLDPEMTIYKKVSPFTMEKYEHRFESEFIGYVDEQTAIEVLNGTMDKKLKDREESINELLEEEKNKKETKEETLEKEVSQAVKNPSQYQSNIRQQRVDKNIDFIMQIENSNFGIVQVDKAGPSHLYYIVKFENNHWEYVTQHPENSGYVSGKYINEELVLNFKDTNNQSYTWISSDGENWIEK